MKSERKWAILLLAILFTLSYPALAVNNNIIFTKKTILHEKNSYILISNSNEPTNYPIVSALEKEVLGNTYNGDIYERLERLENKVFSASFTKDSLSDRVERLRNSIDLNNNKQLSSENYSDNTINIIDRLFDAEINIFGTAFEEESVQSRLNRLEKTIFGYQQNGDIPDRIINAYEMSKTNINKFKSESNQEYSQLNTVSQSQNNKSYDSYTYEQNPYQQPQVAQNNSSVLKTIKEIAYPFLKEFLSNSDAGDYVPQQAVDEFFGYSGNYNNYGSPYNALYNNQDLTPAEKQLLRQYYNGFGGKVRIIP